MKSFIILAFLISAFSCLNACPPQGDSKDENVRAMDVLKNRPMAPTAAQIDTAITLEAMLAPGDDSARFGFAHAASIMGYVAVVKDGGPESCNCHSKLHRDTHIVIVPEMSDSLDPKKFVIVEVTPRFRKQLGTTDELRKFLGQKVTVTGWTFFDAEHKQNAVNTATSDGDIWRATAWEVHPVSGISVTP